MPDLISEIYYDPFSLRALSSCIAPYKISQPEKLESIRKSSIENLLHIALWREHNLLLKDLSEMIFPEVELLLDSSVQLRSKTGLSDRAGALLQKIVEGLIPWRKGPFNLFGVEIDAEWRSDLKWERVLPHIDDMHGKLVADVGCNNGYYMFRMLQHKPALVAGFDPGGRCFYQFDLFQRFIHASELIFELLGVDDLIYFPEVFDMVFCMGVVYHRRDPFGALRALKECLKPGGQLIFENLAIAGDEPYCLCPPDRYGKMKNVWFIPKEGAVEAWLKKVGFIDVKRVSSSVVTPEEQRQTRYAPWESLMDYLDPEDPHKTVEGYPAPIRVVHTARKKGK
ncbi:MAG: tRNA 5-methoxyuridine(34)/uridine 5-oxyacetic acid(34) synthase CmoB [Candidatus Dadabacteria bacterium]|nr:MAG: tRNA 5-methoxyuridine(34)/uridine 5-oxyacetic acid(34) synthase CmoB [Candidatus Dadabacteria bacterium]